MWTKSHKNIEKNKNVDQKHKKTSKKQKKQNNEKKTIFQDSWIGL